MATPIRAATQPLKRLSELKTPSVSTFKNIGYPSQSSRYQLYMIKSGNVWL